MQIKFLGATREVTGSKHLLEINKKKVLLDCGMFQGRRREAEEKNRHLPFDAKEIDAVILSHAHLDHCGSLPTMYAQGFRGVVFATPATRDVAELIMMDSAHVQRSDNRHIAGIKQQTEPEPPIYTETEVEGVLGLFEQVPYHQEFKIFPELTGMFQDAGHILGSAVIELTIKTGAFKKIRLGFTGDLGRTKMPVLKDPQFMRDLDAIICESTYGDRLHDSFDQAKRVLKKYTLEAVKRNARIIVPSFALGRTQELVYILHQLIQEKQIPKFPIYVDSPLAMNVTDVFADHPECYDQETYEDFGKADPFGFKNLDYIQSTDESRSLNRKKGPLMIISAAGMCEGGRIRHHLKTSIENPNNMVMVTGFMARNTLGRKIVEQEKMIKIFDNMYHLRAQVVVMNAFSAHADAVDLVNYIEQVGDRLKNIFIVHGEENQSQALRDKLIEINPKYQVTVPEFEQVVSL